MPYVLANTLNKVLLVRGEGLTTPATQSLVITASQTIRRGDFLIKNASANTFEQAISLPGSNNTASDSGGNGAFAAIAAEDITTNSAGIDPNTGKTTIQAWILGPHLRFGLRVYAATNTDAELRDVALGTPYRLARFRGASATNWFYVLSTTTTNGEIVPVETYSTNNDPAGQYPVLWCRLVTTEANQVL